MEPKNPPKMVNISLEAKLFLYNCIEAATNKANINESINEVFVFAVKLKLDELYFHIFKNKNQSNKKK
jgi:hypothetical protein